MNKKRRISKTENLNSAGHSGEIRGKIGQLPSLAKLQMAPSSRAGRPVGCAETPFFNDVAYDKYLSQVLTCTKIVNESTSLDVLAKYRSMISKMRGLFEPKLRNEVGFTEVTK